MLRILMLLVFMLNVTIAAFAATFELKEAGMTIDFKGCNYIVTQDNISEKIAKEIGVPYQSLKDTFMNPKVKAVGYDIANGAVYGVLVTADDYSKNIGDFRAIKDKWFTDDKFYNQAELKNFVNTMASANKGAKVSNVDKKVTNDAIYITFDLDYKDGEGSVLFNNYCTLRRGKAIMIQGIALDKAAEAYVKKNMVDIVNAVKYEQSTADEKAYTAGKNPKAEKPLRSYGIWFWVACFVFALKFIFKLIKKNDEKGGSDKTRDIPERKTEDDGLNYKKKTNAPAKNAKDKNEKVSENVGENPQLNLSKLGPLGPDVIFVDSVTSIDDPGFDYLEDKDKALGEVGDKLLKEYVYMKGFVSFCAANQFRNILGLPMATKEEAGVALREIDSRFQQKKFKDLGCTMHELMDRVSIYIERDKIINDPDKTLKLVFQDILKEMLKTNDLSKLEIFIGNFITTANTEVLKHVNDATDKVSGK